MSDESESPNRRTVLRAAGTTLGAAVLGSAAAATSAGRETGTESPTPSAVETAETATPASSPTWSERYNERSKDTIEAVAPTEDGSLVVAGQTYAESTGNDAWLFRVDASTGRLEWSRTYEGSKEADPWPYDSAEAVVQTKDGGFAVAGTTRRESGDNAPLLLKTDADGRATLTKSYRTEEANHSQDLLQTADGGYVLLGDTVVIRTDADGTERWRTRLTSESAEFVHARGVVEAHGGGFVVAGSVSRTLEDYDITVVELTEDGAVAWSRRYDLSIDDWASDVVRTETGYALAGQTCIGGAESRNALLAHVGENGEWERHRTYGGAREDEFRALTATDDGGFFLGGTEASSNPTRRWHWTVKTNADGERQWSRRRRWYFGDVAQTPDGDYVAAGFSGLNPSDGIVANFGRPE